MTLATEITFRDIAPSDAIEATIRKRAEKLVEFSERIVRCRIVVSAPHRRKQKGKIYQIKIELEVPGRNVVVGRKPGNVFAHEDVYVAIRDAFDAAQRQLQDRRRKQAGQVKSHEAPPHGRIAKLFREQGYAFLETPDGREYYVHRNSVLNDAFDKLEIGSEVRFVPERGAMGPQASSVQLVGKHHLGGFSKTKK